MHQIDVIRWLPEGRLLLLDQTRLPREEVRIECADERQVAEAITSMRVRGAPAIGIAAAYGMALAAWNAPEDESRESLLQRLRAARDLLCASRPTAVNLQWAVDRAVAAAEACGRGDDPRHAVLDAALRMHAEQLAADERMGELGSELLPDDGSVLTHCNTGALATGGRGTALGVVRTAWERRKRLHVFVDETRPRLQGARLTTWELARLGIPFTLLVDAAAGLLLRCGRVDAVLVGADRIALNGDVANKIGTYPLALAAREAGVPFYVVAPVSTIDPATPVGDLIPIEERNADEVLFVDGVRVAPEDVGAFNPAFDVTPADLVTAIVTERGIARPPYETSLAALTAAPGDTERETLVGETA
jgi:methylthioribose-1-phosphate isomerase